MNENEFKFCSNNYTHKRKMIDATKNDIGKYSGRAKDFCGEALRKILYYNHHL